MPSSSAPVKRVLRSGVRRRGPSPPPSPPPVKRARRSLPSSSPLSPPSPPPPSSPSSPSSSSSPPSPPSPSIAEVFLEEIKEEFSDHGADGTSFGEVLLSLIDCSEETREKITEFIGNAADKASPGYLDGTVAPLGQWAHWDPAMDNDWDKFVSDIQAAGFKDGLVRELSKPSGPRDALLCCLWHYPTYATTRSWYGQTLDENNDCLKVQCDKILDHSNVRTQDTYPIRRGYHKDGPKPQYEELLGDNTAEILERCEGFALEAVKLAPFSIVLGEHNSDFVRRELEDAEGLHIEQYDLRTSVVMYNKIPSCLVVWNNDEIIVNVIFFSYHGMYWVKQKQPVKSVAFLHDLIWNGVCEWSRVPVARERHFSALGNGLATPPRRNSLQLCFKYRQMEKDNKANIPHKKAIEILRWFFAKEENAAALETVRGLDKSQSVFEVAVKFMGAKGHETERSAEWLESAAGQRRSEALKKGHETMSTEAWKTSESGKRKTEGLSRRGVEANAKKFDAKWNSFYSHAEVQAFLQKPMNELDDRQKKLRAAFEEAQVKSGKKSYLMTQFSFQENGLVYVLPGLKNIRLARSKLVAKEDGTLEWVKTE